MSDATNIEIPIFETIEYSHVAVAIRVVRSTATNHESTDEMDV